MSNAYALYVETLNKTVIVKNVIIRPRRMTTNKDMTILNKGDICYDVNTLCNSQERWWCILYILS